MPSTRIEFIGSLGHPLAGRLDTPDGAPRAWAVIALEGPLDDAQRARLMEIAECPVQRTLHSEVQVVTSSA
jgi:uncharacterized OsmC-like protein